MSDEAVISLLEGLIRESIVDVDAPADPDRINKDHPLIYYVEKELAKKLASQVGYGSRGLGQKLRSMLEDDPENLKAIVRELVYKYYRSKVIVEGPPDRFKGSGKRARWTF
jgi:hypothetical protein